MTISNEYFQVILLHSILRKTLIRWPSLCLLSVTFLKKQRHSWIINKAKNHWHSNGFYEEKFLKRFFLEIRATVCSKLLPVERFSPPYWPACGKARIVQTSGVGDSYFPVRFLFPLLYFAMHRTDMFNIVCYYFAIW